MVRRRQSKGEEKGEQSGREAERSQSISLSPLG